MPSGSMGEHGHVLVVGDRLGELIEELLHRLGIDMRHHQRERIVGTRLDRPKNSRSRLPLCVSAISLSVCKPL